jgi:predicted RNA polymerase sigma factor
VPSEAVSSEAAIEGLLRELAPQVLGALVPPGTAVRRLRRRRAGGAARHRGPVACRRRTRKARSWLLTVASRALVDYWRTDSAGRRREATAALDPTQVSTVEPHDAASGAEDAVVLLFLCCHPVLSPPSQLALTLRAVGGLSTAQIAAAFLVPEATMAQRIGRAKQRIRDAGARFVLPPPDERAGRLGVVLHVLYFVFTRATPPVPGRAYTGATSPPRRSGSPGCCTA